MDAFFMETTHYYVYILHAPNFDKYYVGQTGNLSQRIATHNSLKGHRYTSKYAPWELVASFSFKDRSSAMLVEKYIKKRKSKTFIRWLIAQLAFLHHRPTFVNSTGPSIFFNDQHML